MKTVLQYLFVIKGLRNTVERQVLSQHICSGYSIVPVLHLHIESENEPINPSFYSNQEAMEALFDELEKIAEEYSDNFETMMTGEDWFTYTAAEKYNFCISSFIEGPPSYILKQGLGPSLLKYNIAGETNNLNEEERQQFNAPHQMECGYDLDEELPRVFKCYIM